MNNIQIKEMLKNVIEKNRIIHSYMFIGTSLTQKYEYAREFAKTILCENTINSSSCNTCKSCIEFDTNNHPDYIEIGLDDGETIKINQIRKMQEKILEKPIISNKKVYIIKDADLMTKEAQNCLLKTLEEPPKFVTIILLVNNEDLLLTTIKSRCLKVIFSEEDEKVLSEDEKNIYNELEKIFGNVENYNLLGVLGKIDILYKNKEKIYKILDYINIILFNKSKSDIKYIEYIQYVEEAKKRLKSNANYDMTIDNLLLKIFKNKY